MIDFIRKLWELVRPYRARLFLGVITGILAGLTAPLFIATITLVSSVVFQSAGTMTIPFHGIPDFIQPWLERARAGMSNGLQEHSGAVVLLVATIPLAMLLARVMSYMNTYFLQWTAIRAITDLRMKLFSHLLGLSAGFYRKSHSGELISRMMNDTGTLQTVMTNVTSVIIRDPVVLIGILGFMFWRQPKMTLISLVVLPVCIIPHRRFTAGKSAASSREMRNQNAELMQTMTEGFTGHRVIKAYNLEKIVSEKFRETARSSVNLIMRITRATEIPSAVIEFLAAVRHALCCFNYLSVGTAESQPADFIQLLVSHYLHLSAAEKSHAPAKPNRAGPCRHGAGF